ncbi:hypothetical protein FIBSPDRAFT_971772 [Athelia psychrophila]|uniref:Uncharacterized protein n=1 Tax=Athelia psychrophila TaxID=1759441 RepID=A0A166XDM6_9AGAM|nr:hypothetical protein FIBSPDRAFT_971772 [Fibularhizoctonia sp. CBS 109695]
MCMYERPCRVYWVVAVKHPSGTTTLKISPRPSTSVTGGVQYQDLDRSHQRQDRLFQFDHQDRAKRRSRGLAVCTGWYPSRVPQGGRRPSIFLKIKTVLQDITRHHSLELGREQELLRLLHGHASSPGSELARRHWTEDRTYEAIQGHRLGDIGSSRRTRGLAMGRRSWTVKTFQEHNRIQGRRHSSYIRGYVIKIALQDSHQGLTGGYHDQDLLKLDKPRLQDVREALPRVAGW